jgi:hypothetical protein
MLYTNISFAGIVGDTNGDGVVDITEALYTLKIAAGNIPDLPDSCAITGYGLWEIEKLYQTCDVVQNDGSFYICIQSHTSSALNSPFNENVWAILALQGETGVQGPQGEQGTQGLKGDAGTQGPQGKQGIAGADGAIGPQGLKGDKGDNGTQGPQGEVGPAGPAGETGGVVKYDTTGYSFDGKLPYKKFWKQTVYGGESTKISIGIHSHSEETLDGQFVTASTYETGIWADYGLIEYSKGPQYFGWQWSGMNEIFNPPMITMMDNWPLRNTITNMSILKSETPSGFREDYNYRGYTLLGVEDITVPAGIFKDCLKIMKVQSTDTRKQINYIAKDIGTVKIQRANSNGGGWVWELMDIQKEDGTYLFNGNVCQVKGIWEFDTEIPCNPNEPNNTDCVRKGSFSMAYIKGEKSANFIFHDFSNWSWVIKPGLEMTTNDGITYSSDRTTSAKSISLEIKDEVVTAMVFSNPDFTPYTDWTAYTMLTLTGTVTCP